MILKQYFKNISFLFLINFAIKPIWVFVLDRKFQLMYGNELYGNYFSLLSLIYIYSIILDLGIHNYISKKMADKSYSLTIDFYKLLHVKLLLGLLYLLLVVVTLFFFQFSFFKSILFFIIAINQLIFSFFQFGRSFVQGLQRFGLDSWLSSIDRIFLILLGSVLLYTTFGMSLGILSFVGIHFIAYVLSLAITYFFLLRNISVKYNQVSFSFIYRLIKDALPFIIISVLMVIYTRIDAVLLQNIIPNGNEHSGVFALSYRFFDSAYNALYLFSIFLLPAVSAHFSNQNHTIIRQKVIYSFVFATFIALGFIIITFFGCKYIFYFIYKTDSPYAIHTYQLGVWSILGMAWMYVFGSFLTGIGKYKPIIIIVTIGVLLNIGLNLWLIPLYKAVGAAIACSVVQLFVGISKGIYSVYVFKGWKD
jgi:O-antigen/teichoic acid export membrane protein